MVSTMRLNSPLLIAPKLPGAISEKLLTLHERLAVLLQDGLMIAFSGGVDSAFLLWAAVRARSESGGKLAAVTAVSASMAQVERDDAARFVSELGVDHHWETSQEINNPAYAVNDGNRCYHCKTELFRIGFGLVRRHGFRWLAYGYNASDLADTRPGHRAAQENQVLSPLFEAGLTKNDLRTVMRAHGLALSEKPASPCLSSRLMTGVAVTPEKLRDVEALESILRGAGLRVFRVRLHELADEKLLRIEVDVTEMTAALHVRDKLVTEAKLRGYRWITLDLAGYRTGGANL